MDVLVYRVEPEYGKDPVAILNFYREEGRLKVEIRAKNKAIRQHLHLVINSAFYQISPFSRHNGVLSSFALWIEPHRYERLYITYLMDHLGWYGYIIEPLKESVISEGNVLKSLSGFSEAVTKAVEIPQEHVRTNAQGETILTRVPAGYIAVSTDGRVVGPGKFLNAVISGPNARWRLIPKPDSVKSEIEKQQEKLEKKQVVDAGDLAALKDVARRLEIAKRRGNEESAKKALDGIKPATEKRFKEALKKLLSSDNPDVVKIAVNLLDDLIDTKLKAGEKLEGIVGRQESDGEGYEFKQIVEFGKQYLGEEVPLLENLQTLLEDDKYIPKVIEDEDDAYVTMGLSEVDPDLYVALTFSRETGKGVERITSALLRPLPSKVTVAEIISRKGPKVAEGYTVETVTRLYDLSELPKEILKMDLEQLSKHLVEKVKRGEEIDIREILRWGMLFAKKKDSENYLKKRWDIKSNLDKILAKTKVDFDTHIAADNVIEDIVGRFNQEIKGPEDSQFAPRLDTFYHRRRAGDPNKIREKEEYRSEVIKKYFEERNGKSILKVTDPIPFSNVLKELSKKFGVELKKDIGIQWNEKIKLFPHQALAVELFANPKGYAQFGGSEEAVGYFLNAQQGSGKTYMSLAIDLALRHLKPEHWTATKKVKVGNEVKETKIKRPTLILAPLPWNWEEEINNVMRKTNNRGDLVVNISETNRKKRIEQWERLLRSIIEGESPDYVIVNTSKLRYETKKYLAGQLDEDSVSDELKELIKEAKEKGKDVEEYVNEFVEKIEQVDYLYMRMLATGIKSKDGSVETSGLIASAIVDETGQMVNLDTQRTKLLKQLRDIIVDKDGSNGLFVALNGGIVGNSAIDLLVQKAFVNDSLNLDALIEQITKREKNFSRPLLSGLKSLINPSNPKEFEESAKRVIEAAKKAINVAKNEYLLVSQRDVMGEEKLYVNKVDAHELNVNVKEDMRNSIEYMHKKYNLLDKVRKAFKLARENFENKYGKAVVEEAEKLIQALNMGLFNELISQSMLLFDRPRALLDYGSPAWDSLEKKIKARLKSVDDKLVSQFESAVQQYKQEFVVPYSNNDILKEILQYFAPGEQLIGPKTKKVIVGGNKVEIKEIPADERQKAFDRYIEGQPDGEVIKDIVNKTIREEYYSPFAKSLARAVFERVTNTHPSLGKPPKKAVVAMPSKMLAEQVYEQLDQLAAKHGYTIQLVTGDTSAEDRQRIQTVHNSEDKVITIVTSAGARGMNLSSPYMVRLPFWSWAQADQATRRALRRMDQSLYVDEIIPAKAAKHMAFVESIKEVQDKILYYVDSAMKAGKEPSVDEIQKIIDESIPPNMRKLLDVNFLEKLGLYLGRA